MTKEQIHNIYLHMRGKAEGLLEAGAEADFPVMFAEAIIQYNKPRELTEDEIREVADSVCHTWKKNGVGELYMTDFARAILRKASEK